MNELDQHSHSFFKINTPLYETQYSYPLFTVSLRNTVCLTSSFEQDLYGVGSHFVGASASVVSEILLHDVVDVEHVLPSDSIDLRRSGRVLDAGWGFGDIGSCAVRPHEFHNWSPNCQTAKERGLASVRRYFLLSFRKVAFGFD
ncbi:hypothetical protein AVEN_131983-1 [Araneus ventricosus]|uniref:Uncharacterized protein n=1 Tax=Araneus ventricosus TaxID=182803 RepID=A0A4Y2B2H5_ARAVE|nr:hypothetical protein AVEN_131983-1 [Araneus ventricosus]